MLTPKIDVTGIVKGSHKLIPVMCSCGKERMIEAQKYFDGQKTCGRCSWKARDFWLAQSWGGLRLDPDQELPSEWAPMSDKRFRLLCSCGKIYTPPFSILRDGGAVTCGKCNDLPIPELLGRVWHNLCLDPKQTLPESLSLKSNKRFKFLCKCGGFTTASMWEVSSGNTKSCGKCNLKPTSFWLSQVWGNLTLSSDQTLPEALSAGSSKQLKFICSCGNTKVLDFKSVTSGNSKSCGECNYSTKEYWLSKTWGKLRLDPTQELPSKWPPQTSQKFRFLCDCGKSTIVEMYHVTSYGMTRCKCNIMPPDYWRQQRWGKLRLDPKFIFPEDGLELNSNKKVKCICDCGNSNEVYVYHLSEGHTTSCGCIVPGRTLQSPAGEIYALIKPLAEDAIFSWWTILSGKKLEFDMYIPSKRLAIEYHGLVWHSDKFKTNKRDYQKFCLAQENDIRVVQIFQDEWENKQPIIKQYLTSLLAKTKTKRIRPKFVLETSTGADVRSFLDSFHYLGAASGCITVKAVWKNTVVGAWVFMSREEGVVLWHRACWNHEYKCWNPHENALKLAIPELRKLHFNKIVTFADQRFHTGDLYEKLGFHYETTIEPNYYYTSGSRRKSKYVFRVPAGVDEVAAAKEKGWYRIWDSGKRRYSLAL